MALLPLFIWCLLRLHSKDSNKKLLLILASFLFLILASTHHMFFLVIGILIAYIGTYIFVNSDLTLILFSKQIKPAAAIWLVFSIIFIFLQIFGLFIYKNLNISTRYQSGVFFQGTESYKILFNMIIDYTSNISLLLPLGFFGVLILLMKKNKSFNEIFLMIILLIFFPIITWGLYLSPFLLPFLCLFIGFGLIRFVELINNYKILPLKKITSSIVALLFICSLIFSGFMVWWWNLGPNFKDQNIVKPEVENLANFIKNYKPNNNSSFATNSGTFARQVDALSNTPDAPNLDTDIFAYINISDLSIERKKFGLDYFTEPELIYRFNMTKFGTFAQFVSNGFYEEPSKTMIVLYNIKYMVEDNNLPGSMHSSASGPVMVYPLFMSIHEKTPKIYNGKYVSLYYICD